MPGIYSTRLTNRKQAFFSKTQTSIGYRANIKKIRCKCDNNRTSTADSAADSGADGGNDESTDADADTGDYAGDYTGDYAGDYVSYVPPSGIYPMNLE